MFTHPYRPFLRYAEAPTAPAGGAPAAPAVAEPAKLPDDHPLVKALAAQKTELANLKTERDAAKQALEDNQNTTKTEAEKQAARLEKLDQQIKTLQSDKLRAEVAAAKGVPVALLSGATQAELEASADALIAFKGPQGTPTSPLGGNQSPAGPVASVQETPESREDRQKRLREAL